jgi:iron complex outermembrane recepter protein
MFEFNLINTYNYVSQELRLVSLPSDSPLTWTVGLFYKINSRTAYANIYAGPNLDALNQEENGAYQNINLHFDTREAAGYGQLEYAITDKLTALAGVRYYRADLKDSAIGAGADGLVFKPRFTDTSPKFTLSYHLTDSMLIYATAAKGFRIGGINFSTTRPTPENFQRTYDPDILWNYEAGVNSTLFDGRVSANFAVFNALWQNLQDEIVISSNAAIDPTAVAAGDPFSAVQAGGNERMVINAGKAHSRGVEGEFQFLLPLEFTYTLSGAYIQAAVDQDVENPATGGVIPKGTSLENVPKFAGSTSLSHDLRFGGGWGLESSLTYSYRGETHADITNPNESVAPAYGLLNARFGLHGRSSRWSANVFATNLLNKRASSFTFDHSATTNTIPDDTDSPVGYRIIGLRANYEF